MRRRGIISLFALVAAGSASAQLSVYESEPNNTPAEANPIRGEVLVSGSMQKGDQDGYMWTVSDNDARKRWTFELQGTPGRLTIAEVVRVEFADNGSDVAGVQRVMKMGTRDGLAPVIQRDLIFEPGEYLIGIADAGGGSQEGGVVFRPPSGTLSFAESGSPETGDGSALAQVAEPGGYRLSIREGSRLTVSKNPGPRESREAAQAIRVGSEFATFETLETSWYAFSFNEKEATQRWDIPVQAPVGRNLEAALFDENGEQLSSASSDDMGRLSFADLAPKAATYYVELAAKSPGFIHAIASTAVGQRVAGEEAEPNDEWRFANHVDLSQPLTGRISKTGEWDFFRFALDEATTDQVLNLRLDTEPTGQALELCLLGDDKTRVQCRREKSPVELPDLVL
ncbi:MAG TPA: hypothetical protein VK830_07145, partial [Xanthomonadales bacterium]|nr:hypothetical protein [Xanthomonadales bacterium]